MHRLITFRYSHYNEKARWALDRYSVPYREIACMPMLHIPVVIVATRGRFRGAADAISSPFSTPVLITDEGDSIHDSSAIVQYVSRRYVAPEAELYPIPEVATLEKRFHDGLGSDTRRVAYQALLGVPDGFSRIADRNVGPVQAVLFKAMLPFIQRFVRHKLHVDASQAGKSLVRIREELASVDDRLRDGRPYLFGDRFTAADLAFACMLAPALLVQRHEGFGGWLPSLDECGDEYAALVREFRATRSGVFAMRMFAEERGPQR